MKQMIFIILSCLMINACSSDHDNTNNQHEADVIIEFSAYTITANSISFSGRINNIFRDDILEIKIAYSSSNKQPSLSLDNVYSSIGISQVNNNRFKIGNASISGLSPDIKYYFRMYVATRHETYSSEVIAATTKQSIVSAIEVKDITIASAKVVGRINDPSILPIYSNNIGVLYGTSKNELNARVHLNEYAGGLLDEIDFEITLKDLKENTTYYVASFFYNGYDKEEIGEVLNFTTVKQNDSGIFLGHLDLSTNEDIENFGNKDYNEIQGSLTISGDEIKTLQRLRNKLQKIDGDVHIECLSLTTLDGLYGLTEIDGDLKISNAQITSMEGLNNLTKIFGDLELSYLASLLSFEGLKLLENIGNDFVAKGLPQIESFNGLNQLLEIGGNFEIGGAVSANGGYEMNSLKTFEGLDKLQSIRGDFFIDAWSELNNLISFKGLGGLKNIFGAFYIRGRAYDHNGSRGCKALNKLYSFEGLESLEYIGGDFEVRAYFSLSQTLTKYELFILESLISFNGLNNLNKIDGNIGLISEVSSTPYTKGIPYALNKLIFFQGLESLADLQGNICISANGGGQILNSFESLKGLENIEKIHGNLTINATGTSLSNFSSFEGLQNLTSVAEDVNISASNLVSFENLANFEGLNNLVYIGGSLNVLSTYYNIYNNPFTTFKSLTSLDGLNNLVRVAGDLTLSNLSELYDIQLLSKLEQVQNITINRCPNLFDFTSLKGALTNYDYIFYSNGNGYNPTRYQILNGQGKP